MLDDKIPMSSIINIASIIGKTGNVGQCNYAASKAGVEAFTRSVSKELAKYVLFNFIGFEALSNFNFFAERHNIRCNAVLPGFIETPMVQSVPDKVKEKFKALIPFGRMGLPEG
jgi:17beta-estradiol 17-dehydrogenase/3alpha(17beta)-hydroxysteroid dehydrogenase (NAD+)